MPAFSDKRQQAKRAAKRDTAHVTHEYPRRRPVPDQEFRDAIIAYAASAKA
jgi:hypothetical protein